MPDQPAPNEPDRSLDGRDLAMIQRQSHALEDRVNANIEGLRKQGDITWEAYKRETALHAVNHAHEHARDNEARQIALGGMEKRLEGMNEFRAQLKEQASTFATKEMLEQLRLRFDTLGGQLPTGYATKDIVEALDKRLDTLEKYQSNMQGRLWAMGAGIGAVVVLVNIAIRFL